MNRRTLRFWNRNKHLIYVGLILSFGLYLGLCGIDELLWLARVPQ